MSELEILKCLGEETKFKIIKLLLNGELCACEIPKLIQRTQSNTSMHLKKLIEKNILQSRREGKSIIYSIQDNRVIDVFKALGYKDAKKLNSCCCMKGEKNEC